VVDDYYLLGYNVIEITESHPTFRGINHLNLQGRKINRARNQHESRWEAEQLGCRNFGLSRKQNRNGRQQFSASGSSREQNEPLSDTTKRTNTRQEQVNQHGASLEAIRDVPLKHQLNFQRTTWNCNIPECITLPNHLCQNLKWYMVDVLNTNLQSHTQAIFEVLVSFVRKLNLTPLEIEVIYLVETCEHSIETATDFQSKYNIFLSKIFPFILLCSKYVSSLPIPRLLELLNI
jgi:hypothetical protein